jgi:hypothetical protein
MISPMRKRMMSPGTTSRAGIVFHCPPRRTRALLARVFLSAAMVLSAWNSSQNPTAAFTNKRVRMIPKSGQCRTSADSIAATSIIQGMGPQK